MNSNKKGFFWITIVEIVIFIGMLICFAVSFMASVVVAETTGNQTYGRLVLAAGIVITIVAFSLTKVIVDAARDIREMRNSRMY